MNKLIMFKETAKKIGADIISMSIKRKIVLGLSVAVVGASAVGMVSYMSEPKAVEEEPVVEEAVVEEIPEVVEEEVPTTVYSGMSIKPSSMEKDLDIYLVDSAGNKIKVTGASVKLVKKDKSPSKTFNFSDAVLAAEKADDADPAAETTLTSETESTSIEPDQFGLCYVPTAAYETALAEYNELVDSIDGTILKDDNGDGRIYAKDLEAGDYVIWYMPIEGYFPAKPSVAVTVKDKVETEVVENIEEKVEEYDASQDVKPAEATETEKQVDYNAILSQLTTSGEAERKIGKAKAVAPAMKESTTPKTPAAALKDTSGNQLYTDAACTKAATAADYTSGATYYKASVKSIAASAVTNAPTAVTNVQTTAVAPTMTKTTELEDSTAALKDSEGHALYTDNQCETVATASDYTSGTTYYYKTTTQAEGEEEKTEIKEASAVAPSTKEVDTTTPADETAPLKDADGNQLYTDEACTQAATAADYDASNPSKTFWRKGTSTEDMTAVLTTTVGSTTYNLYKDQACTTAATKADYAKDATYYYKTGEADISAAKPEMKQVPKDENALLYDADKHELYLDADLKTTAKAKDYEEDKEYYYLESESLSGLGLGIDVSKFNSVSDWGAVKSAGVNYAIIRCGGRYRSSRQLYEDPKFASYASGASSAGIKVGAYFYSTATSVSEAVEEASAAVTFARGHGVTLPIFIDMEDSTLAALSTSERVAIAKAFCDTVRSAGYQAGVYASMNWWLNYLDYNSLCGYKIWIARYNDVLSGGKYTWNGRCDIWQYTSKGSISGISGNVDCNVSMN